MPGHCIFEVFLSCHDIASREEKGGGGPTEYSRLKKMLFHFSKACILHYGPMRKLYKNDESIN
jgi:hypothetical protein